MKEKIIILIAVLLILLMTFFIIFFICGIKSVEAFSIAASVPENPCNQCLKYCK